MATTAKAYGKSILSLINKEILIANSTGDSNLKIMLLTSTGTGAVDQDAHQYKASVTGEASGAGYTAGGQFLKNVTVSYDAATNTVRVNADNPVWPTSTTTARGYVIYDDTPTADSAKPLIGYGVFDADVSTTSGTFTITWNGGRVINLSTP
ncbi:hypothetical protein [Gordonia sp. (in: high G+C Gram-positive bacteria)]|uniref:hypothetical protein n=1 Tax=Gordonia sp. (in: high G+C Gram-positive bacteria) TaxID=84139 RepID=UPI003F9435DF